MAVNILADNEQASRGGSGGDQAELALLGRMLIFARHAEAMQM